MCEKLILRFLSDKDIICIIISDLFPHHYTYSSKINPQTSLEDKHQLQYDNKGWIWEENKLIVKN